MVGRQTVAIARRTKAARKKEPRAATHGQVAAQSHSQGPSPGRVSRCQGRRDDSTSVRLGLDELVNLGPFLRAEDRLLAVDLKRFVKVLLRLDEVLEFRAGAA